MGLIEMSYYVEVNLICIFFLGLVLLIHRRDKNNRTTTYILYQFLTMAILVYCISDIFCRAYDGSSRPEARIILYLSNIIYIALQLIISCVWIEYVDIRLGTKWLNKTRKLIMRLPFLMAGVLLLTAPLDGLVFTISADNLYVRGPLTLIIPIICWIFMVIVTGALIYIYLHESMSSRRRTMLPLIGFIIPPMIGSILQVCMYGLTTTQVGFTMSVMLIYMYSQNDQISQDELTGLNNRREIDKYLESQLLNGKTFFLCMIDVDKFKSINDTYGHVEGDEALKSVSRILRLACSHSTCRLFLARYGGDEFIIAGIDKPMAELMNLIRNIELETAHVNEEINKPYKLQLSVGYTTGKCAEYKSPSDVLREADEAMYKVKLEKKRYRA